ncbi:hypothetical protein HDV57DRAFT_478988 [Trichoderma longibrachiatum]
MRGDVRGGNPAGKLCSFMKRESFGGTMQTRGDSQQLISLAFWFLGWKPAPHGRSSIEWGPRLGAPDRRGERFRRFSAPLLSCSFPRRRASSGCEVVTVYAVEENKGSADSPVQPDSVRLDNTRKPAPVSQQMENDAQDKEAK